MARLIKVGEKPVEVEPKNGNDFTIEELLELIGGYVQVIGLDDGEIAIVDEEGLLKRLPLNIESTMYVREHTGLEYTIVGTTLICKRDQLK